MNVKIDLVDCKPSMYVDTVNIKAKQYQECETLITRIEVRIMRD